MELSVLGGKSKEVLEWSTTEWSSISGVWVPKHSEMQRRKPKGQLRLDLSWEGVNESVPLSMFELTALGPEITVVNDFRQGVPKSMSLNEFESIEGVTSTDGANRNPTRIVLISLNVAIVFALFGYLLYRRRAMLSCFRWNWNFRVLGLA
jgi:hypothetical protein